MNLIKPFIHQDQRLMYDNQLDLFVIISNNLSLKDHKGMLVIHLDLQDLEDHKDTT